MNISCLKRMFSSSKYLIYIYIYIHIYIFCYVGMSIWKICNLRLLECAGGTPHIKFSNIPIWGFLRGQGLSCAYTFDSLLPTGFCLTCTYKGGVGWGGVVLMTYRSAARQTWGYIRPKGGVGWGGAVLITYRSGTRQTWGYIRPKGGAGWGGAVMITCSRSLRHPIRNVFTDDTLKCGILFLQYHIRTEHGFTCTLHFRSILYIFLQHQCHQDHEVYAACAILDLQ